MRTAYTPRTRLFHPFAIPTNLHDARTTADFLQYIRRHHYFPQTSFLGCPINLFITGGGTPPSTPYSRCVPLPKPLATVRWHPKKVIFPAFLSIKYDDQTWRVLPDIAFQVCPLQGPTKSSAFSGKIRSGSCSRFAALLPTRWDVVRMKVSPVSSTSYHQRDHTGCNRSVLRWGLSQGYPQGLTLKGYVCGNRLW